MKPEQIAVICHEANKAYCESHEDFSQYHWFDAPGWQRISAINGVKAHLDSGLNLTPQESHMAWFQEKDDAGWVYGDVKDPLAKTHPCMVPYDELPEFQKRKDYLFRAIVHAIAGEIK